MDDKIIADDILQDLPPEVIKDQRLAIMEARKPGKEDAISDTESEITGRWANSSQSGEGEERSNAETQTALRGISLENIIRNNRVESSSSDVSFRISHDMSSKIIKQNFRHLIFLWQPSLAYWSRWMALQVLAWQPFPPSSSLRTRKLTGIKGKYSHEKKENLRKHQLNSRFSNRRSLAEPLLICDLPGQNINLGDRIRSNNQDGVGLENLDNNNQGSDMSFDVETLRTLPVIDGAQNPSETL